VVVTCYPSTPGRAGVLYDIPVAKAECLVRDVQSESSGMTTHPR
jgi:hypothetical protein